MTAVENTVLPGLIWIGVRVTLLGVCVIVGIVMMFVAGYVRWRTPARVVLAAVSVVVAIAPLMWLRSGRLLG